MANLKETARWEAGIYQLETTDPVVGGADGVSNKQASQLANRTAYLKTQIEANQTGLNAELAKKLNTETYNTEKRNFALTSDLNAKYNSADMTAAAIANKGVLRDNNGDIQSRALKCTLANQNTTSLSGDAAIVYRMNNSNDSYLRFCSISTFRRAVGLGNVDNTSDASKPVSTATQTALNLKLNTATYNADKVNFALKSELNAKLDVSAFNGAFASVKSANGYMKLPGGMILQWGVSGDLKADNQVTLTFPIAFPNHCLNVQASTVSAIGNDRDAMVQINEFNTTQLKVILQNLRIAAGNGYYCRYFAIGY